MGNRKERYKTMDTNSDMNSDMNSANDFLTFLRDFDDMDLNRYTCFSGEFRDQRLEAGAMAEAGFWNTIVNLCIDERLRREGEVRRLEYMYRTGCDLDEED